MLTATTQLATATSVLHH